MYSASAPSPFDASKTAVSMNYEVNFLDFPDAKYINARVIDGGVIQVNTKSISFDPVGGTSEDDILGLNSTHDNIITITLYP